MLPRTPQCDRCHRFIEPRGHSTLRFCPTCGERLAQPVEPLSAESPPPETMPHRTSLQAIAGLVLAVISLVIQPCAFPVGLISILLGLTAQKSIERSAGMLVGRGFALGAVVLGLISVILWLLLNVLARPVHHGYVNF